MPQQLPLLDAPAVTRCCAPLAAAPLSAAEATDLATRLKALADPARLRVLSLMLANQDLEACTCDLTDTLGLSQPTVTHHLKKLTDAGLVFAQRRQGPWTYYRVVPEALAGLAEVISPGAATADGAR